MKVSGHTNYFHVGAPYTYCFTDRILQTHGFDSRFIKDDGSTVGRKLVGKCATGSHLNFQHFNQSVVSAHYFKSSSLVRLLAFPLHIARSTITTDYVAPHTG